MTFYVTLDRFRFFFKLGVPLSSSAFWCGDLTPELFFQFLCDFELNFPDVITLWRIWLLFGLVKFPWWIVWTWLYMPCSSLHFHATLISIQRRLFSSSLISQMCRKRLICCCPSIMSSLSYFWDFCGRRLSWVFLPKEVHPSLSHLCFMRVSVGFWKSMQLMIRYRRQRSSPRPKFHVLLNFSMLGIKSIIIIIIYCIAVRSWWKKLIIYFV